MDKWVIIVWGEIYIKHTFHVYCNVNMEMYASFTLVSWHMGHINSNQRNDLLCYIFQLSTGLQVHMAELKM